MLRAHDDEKHGNMCAFADSISVEVGTDAHSVAVRTGVKRRRIETDGTSIDSISVSPPKSWNLSIKVKDMSVVETTLTIDCCAKTREQTRVYK